MIVAIAVGTIVVTVGYFSAKRMAEKMSDKRDLNLAEEFYKKVQWTHSKESHPLLKEKSADLIREMQRGQESASAWSRRLNRNQNEFNQKSSEIALASKSFQSAAKVLSEHENLVSKVKQTLEKVGRERSISREYQAFWRKRPSRSTEIYGLLESLIAQKEKIQGSMQVENRKALETFVRWYEKNAVGMLSLLKLEVQQIDDFTNCKDKFASAYKQLTFCYASFKEIFPSGEKEETLKLIEEFFSKIDVHKFDPERNIPWVKETIRKLENSVLDHKMKMLNSVARSSPIRKEKVTYKKKP